MKLFSSLPLEQKFPIFFGILILLTVSAPFLDLYKIFFHLILCISVVVLLYRRNTGINWRDPFLCMALVLATYASITTFFVSEASLAENVRAFRWGVESTFFVFTLFIVLKSVIASSRVWGRLFCGMTILGAGIAFAQFSLFGDFQGRLAGWGALTNPISAASVLTVYWAIGTFLLLNDKQKVSGEDLALSFFALTCVLIVSLLSESRGPIIALLLYLLWFSVSLIVYKNYFRLLWLLPAIIIVGLVFIEHLYGIQPYISAMLDRGGSYRLEIWSALLRYPPDSLLLGAGAGTPPMDTEAGKTVFEPMGLHVTHAHNLFIGTFTETGLLGLGLLLGLLTLPFWSVFTGPFAIGEKLHLLGLLGLMLMLSVTDTHTLIISIKAVWFYGWLPVVFVWYWSWYAHKSR